MLDHICRQDVTFTCEWCLSRAWFAVNPGAVSPWGYPRPASAEAPIRRAPGVTVLPPLALRAGSAIQDAAAPEGD